MIKDIIQRFKNLSENNRNVIKNILGAFLVKGASLIVSLFTMPVYIRYFQDEVVLGLWFTVLSVLTWILNFDLGIGNGLRNHLTQTLVSKDHGESKKYISSAYVSIGVLCAIVAVIFWFVSGFINWNTVFNIESGIVSYEALLTAVRIVFIGILLQLFLKLISSVLYAMQKSSVNNLLTLCTSIIVLLLVLILPSKDNDSNIICMAIVQTIAVLLPLLVASIIVFAGALRKAIPSFRFFTFKHTKEVLSLGGIFFYVQIAYMLIMSTNEYLISFFVGNEAVVEYQIYHKIFSLGSTLFALALTPIWSAVTKALAERDFNWVKSLYKKLLILTGLGCICELLIIPFLQVGINIWLGEESIVVNYSYALSFALLGCFMIMNSTLSSIANGAGELKTQAIFFSVGAILKVPVAWLLINITGSWIGVVISNAISMVLYCVIQPVWLKQFFNKREKEG